MTRVMDGYYVLRLTSYVLRDASLMDVLCDASVLRFEGSYFSKDPSAPGRTMI
jgi:hypothetical protein